MRKKILFFILFYASAAGAQKQNIDVDLLSDIISAKQSELKTRVLSNIVVKNIHPTNYVTYNTIYNLVEILTTEKNKTVMTQGIVRQIADYVLVVGLANYFVTANVSQNKKTMFLLLSNDGQIRAEDFTKLTGGLPQLMKSAYLYDSTKNNKEQSEKAKILSTVDDEIKWNNLLANFLIDTAYQVLTEKENIRRRGFFKKDPQRHFFNSGLNIDYTGVRKHFNENKKELIDKYIKFIKAPEEISGCKDSILTFAKDEKIQFNDFGKAGMTKEQISLLLYLFDQSVSTFRDQVGRNNFIATIGDIIAKYVIFDVRDDDPEKIVYNFKIDVEAIILAFEDKFYAANISTIRKHKIGIKPFFTIGFNYGYFIDQDNIFKFETSSKNLTQIALAGEKFGIKFVFADYKFARAHAPMEWYKYKGSYRRWLNPVPKPLINNIYAMIYGSGLLFNIVDLRSETNFKYAVTGLSIGLEFFNGLEFNLGYAMPVVPKENISGMFKKGFINAGFDIPIFEYLRALREKRR